MIQTFSTYLIIIRDTFINSLKAEGTRATPHILSNRNAFTFNTLNKGGPNVQKY